MSEPIVPSRACPQLPLVFLFSMSSPVPNYLDLTYRPSSFTTPTPTRRRPLGNSHLARDLAGKDSVLAGAHLC